MVRFRSIPRLPTGCAPPLREGPGGRAGEPALILVMGYCRRGGTEGHCLPAPEPLHESGTGSRHRQAGALPAAGPRPRVTEPPRRVRPRRPTPERSRPASRNPRGVRVAFRLSPRLSPRTAGKSPQAGGPREERCDEGLFSGALPEKRRHPRRSGERPSRGGGARVLAGAPRGQLHPRELAREQPIGEWQEPRAAPDKAAVSGPSRKKSRRSTRRCLLRALLVFSRAPFRFAGRLRTTPPSASANITLESSASEVPVESRRLRPARRQHPTAGQEFQPLLALASLRCPEAVIGFIAPRVSRTPDQLARCVPSWARQRGLRWKCLCSASNGPPAGFWRADDRKLPQCVLKTPSNHPPPRDALRRTDTRARPALRRGGSISRSNLKSRTSPSEEQAADTPAVKPVTVRLAPGSTVQENPHPERLFPARPPKPCAMRTCLARGGEGRPFNVRFRSSGLNETINSVAVAPVGTSSGPARWRRPAPCASRTAVPARNVQ